MQLRVLILFVSLLSCSQLFALEGITIREAVNKSARQKALTQRIAKVYLALNDNLYEPKFYQERDQAIELFQKQLDELKWYTPTDKIKSSLKYVRELWKDYKAVADWSINKEGASKLIHTCDEILIASDQLQSAYEDYARQLYNNHLNSDILTIVTLMEDTGIQRMLTQRLMLFYLALKQDIESPIAKRKLSTSIEEYKNVFVALKTAEVNSTAIKTELQNMEANWKTLEKMLGNMKNSAEDISTMLSLTDQLAEGYERISVLYEDLGIKLSVSKSINIAAYQNMLTQRIAKSYVAVAYNQMPGRYKRELISSVDLFEGQMKSMIRSASTEDIKSAVNVVQIMWKNYKKLVLNWENMDEISVTKVLEKAHIMMAACDKVAQEIENYAQTIPDYKAFFVQKNGEAVEDKNNIARQTHLAGLQRVYSQRIAIYYLMNALKVDSRLSQQRMDACIANYKQNFEQMISSKINTKAINNGLNNAHKNWDAIEQLCASASKDKIPTVLTHSSELFEKLDQLNLLYEKHMDHMFMEK